MGKKGFTLVELLVVISIIAVLSVIGITIFSSTQKEARNSRRRSDIDAIAKAMEVNYNGSTGQYPNLLDSFFAGGIAPTDPLNGTTKCGSPPGGLLCKYCVAPRMLYNCEAGDKTVSGGTDPYPKAGTGFIICANLEKQGNGVYCRQSTR